MPVFEGFLSPIALLLFCLINAATTMNMTTQRIIKRVKLVTNSATSQQCAAASEELSNQASRMREMLSIYNLGNGSIAVELVTKNFFGFFFITENLSSSN